MPDLEYDPFHWHWQVSGRDDYWSSELSSYVDNLPDGVIPTHIASEQELSEVLAVYRLPGPVVVVPERVSARRFRMQLRLSGLLDQVNQWVSGQNPLVQDAFEYSGEFVRSEPMMASGFASMGFSEEEIDAFFVAAAAL